MRKYILFNDDVSCIPSNEMCVMLVNEIKKILFPNFYECHFIIEERIDSIKQILKSQLKCAYTLAKINEDILNVTKKFIDEMPKLIEDLNTDLEAAYDGDPAAYDKIEIVLAYPGFEAIIFYRIAHILYCLNVPYIPRILSEYAHSVTGIDIHPGATIGQYFFIDHGTGVVIGQTAVIGDNVKIYQGVTLGALSLKEGRKLSNIKRHPTIKDNVTIYAGASILGGETIIGENCVIKSNAFIIESIN